MVEYLERLADGRITGLIRELPALALTGPRASGKTTTAARYARTVIRLDRKAEALAVAADPDAAIDGLDEPVLLDEWQEIPQVLAAVDQHAMGLTGPSNSGSSVSRGLSKTRSLPDIFYRSGPTSSW